MVMYSTHPLHRILRPLHREQPPGPRCVISCLCRCARGPRLRGAVMSTMGGASMGQWVEVASVRAGPLPPPRGGAARSRGARDTILPWIGAAGLRPQAGDADAPTHCPGLFIRAVGLSGGGMDNSALEVLHVLCSIDKDHLSCHLAFNFLLAW